MFGDTVDSARRSASFQSDNQSVCAFHNNDMRKFSSFMYNAKVELTYQKNPFRGYYRVFLIGRQNTGYHL
jgi:hypothetical protein